MYRFKIGILSLILPALIYSKPEFNPDISASGLFSTAWFSKENHLNFGGHDPKHFGFNVQNVELALAHNVDPYLSAEVHLITLLEEGETIVELEEAYFETQNLPGSVTLLGGQYFTRVGRLNASHPHNWSFADQPVILNRIYGSDGLRNPGLSLFWLAPLPFYFELTGGAQQSNGLNAFSFLGDGGGNGHTHGHDSPVVTNDSQAVEGIGGFTITDKHMEEFSDLLLHMGSELSFDLNEQVAVLAGVDYITAPNNKGPNNRTHIYSGDFYVKWKPDNSRLGFPFVKWQTEFIWRNYEAGINRTTIVDYGLYSQAVLGVIERWTLGVRGEYADSQKGEIHGTREERVRLSWNITFFPSEFSKFRVQHNLDITHDENIQGIFLQAEFNIGSHGAHQF